LNAPVVGFIGRFTRDKGLAELMSAFGVVRREFPAAYLLLVGDFEEGDPLGPVIRNLIRTLPGVIKTGFVQDPSGYYHAMDVLALPTHREGFPNVPLEAAAAGKPVVTTNATGAVDSVVDGITGLIVPVGDIEGLAGALTRLLISPDLARAMGRAGRERVLRDFRQEDIWDGLARVYLELLRDTDSRGSVRKLRTGREY